MPVIGAHDMLGTTAGPGAWHDQDGLAVPGEAPGGSGDRNRCATGGYMVDVARQRVVLAAAAAVPLAAVSGCQGISVLGTPPPPPSDVVQLQAAIAAEELMVARYAAVLGQAHSWPAAAARVLPSLQAEHQAHLAQLRSRLVVPAGSAASPSPPGHAAAGPAVPAGPAAAIAFLAGAEHASTTAMLGRLMHAPASLAQLYASISASEATHVPLLDQAGQAAG
jgi:hypothetical protein